MEFNQAELEHFRNSQRPYATQRRERRMWGTLRIWDKFAFFLYVAAFLLLLTSIFLFVVPTLILLFAELGLVSLVPTVLLTFPKLTLFQIATGTFILSVVLMLLARWRVMHNLGLRPECGCPVCQERELIRVPRKRRDRMFSFVGVTAWRYACRNCTWGGLRVGGQMPLSVPVKAVPAIKKATKFEPSESDFEEVVFQSYMHDQETESVEEIMPLTAAPQPQIMEDVTVLEVRIDEVKPSDEQPILAFVETAVDDLPHSEVPHSDKAESPNTAAEAEALKTVDINAIEFDSEFERLCYEVAQAR